MHKALWALGGLAVLLVAGGIAIWSLLVPLVPGAAIKASCHDPLTQACIDQIRALGDDFAAKGNLAEAASWYGWAAKGGDKVAMFQLGGVNYARAVDDAARQTHSDFVANEEGRRASVTELNGFPAATACGWGEVLNLLGNWWGASFGCESANGLWRARQRSTPWRRDYPLRSALVKS